MKEDPNYLLKQIWERMETLPSALRHEAKLGFLNGLLAILKVEHVEHIRKAFANDAAMQRDFIDLIDGHLALREILGDIANP